MQEYGDETASLKHAKNDIASFTTALNVHQLFYSAVLWTIFQMTNFQIQDDEFCTDQTSLSGLNVVLRIQLTSIRKLTMSSPYSRYPP